ncbi:hypothetical protein BZA05DRAFT_383654 [Tricharina praecox]|uniref:uncharacterized protein n=1 Tax=Tricharina praecox TaxID=43433 RepID=UPI00221E7265|nr:uncharacterized protein BZA05DRAFT_383654 [Tricharina praecox]KAI5859203.1 hypothetical protein BZA05DRAFT_383654 [Tricharina praecox]
MSSCVRYRQGRIIVCLCRIHMIVHFISRCFATAARLPSTSFSSFLFACASAHCVTTACESAHVLPAPSSIGQLLTMNSSQEYLGDISSNAFLPARPQPFVYHDPSHVAKFSLPRPGLPARAQYVGS